MLREGWVHGGWRLSILLQRDLNLPGPLKVSDENWYQYALHFIILLSLKLRFICLFQGWFSWSDQQFAPKHHFLNFCWNIFICIYIVESWIFLDGGFSCLSMSDIFTSRNAWWHLIFHRFDHSSLQSLTLTVSHFTKFYNFLDNFDKWNKNLISGYFYDSLRAHSM